MITAAVPKMDVCTENVCASGTHTIAGLVGALPEVNFYQLLHQDNIVKTRPIEELRQLWETSHDRLSQPLASTLPNTSITYLPSSLGRYVQELRQRPTYQRDNIHKAV